MHWFLSRSLAGEKVCVKEADFRRARGLLEEADATTHILHGEIRCPKCASSDLEYPQFTRKSLFRQRRWKFAASCILLTGSFIVCIAITPGPRASSFSSQQIDRLNWPVKKMRVNPPV